MANDTATTVFDDSDFSMERSQDAEHPLEPEHPLDGDHPQDMDPSLDLDHLLEVEHPLVDYDAPMDGENSTDPIDYRKLPLLRNPNYWWSPNDDEDLGSMASA